MNIILIDDNISTTSLLQASINWHTLDIEEVFVANSAKEAYSLITSRRIDIMICDIEMPLQDGFSLLRSLREEGNPIVCLFLTAHAEFEFARRAIELGSVDYILKPFEIAELTEKISKAVQKAQQNKQDIRLIQYGKAWISSSPSLSSIQNESILLDDVQENEIIRNAKNYMADHYAQDISLQNIADYVHHNPNYLIRLFRKSENATPMDYLNKIRIQQAKLLLSSNKFTVSQIALMTGFNNIPYFSKFFKKITGFTPSEYKAQLK